MRARSLLISATGLLLTSCAALHPPTASSDTGLATSDLMSDGGADPHIVFADPIVGYAVGSGSVERTLDGADWEMVKTFRP